ncbi:hypothetical protein DICVIV_02931 [Dictyocaulus viviparus]|uniref:Uncharacterized protein n=1 Tax=Dictyocaulus viviparus TaxID=29172 RepID=A0A0D8Y3W7_DICVI|nr:hypothetical protein DICVIV_02931 [Dictyocaulus viviparus]
MTPPNRRVNEDIRPSGIMAYGKSDTHRSMSDTDGDLVYIYQIITAQNVGDGIWRSEADDIRPP